MQIGRRSRAELKRYFVRDSIPTESNFADLIDAMLNQQDDGIARPLNGALSIEAAGDATSQKSALHVYGSFSDDSPAWVLSLRPRQDPANASTARDGFSIGDGAGNSRLFIERGTGNVGLGTVAPRAALHVGGGAADSPALMLSSSGTGWGSGLQLENTASGGARTFGIHAGAGALHFVDVTASAERMLITKEGDVGIGTTKAPRGRLDVPTGDAFVGRSLHISAESDGDNAGVLNIYNATNKKYWHITHRAGEADKLIFWRNDASAGPLLAVLKLGMDGTIEAPSGALLRSIGIGTQVHGRTRTPYETIQMAPTHNLRIAYGATEHYVFGKDYFRVRGAKGEGAYMGADGNGGDVQFGSTQPHVTLVSIWSSAPEGQGRGLMRLACREVVGVSDARLKDNIEPVAGALDKVSRLRGVWFNWKQESQDAARSRHLGLLAQEVQAVVPEAVVEVREGQLAISSQAMTVLLVEAMKEQQEQLDTLRGALKALREQRQQGQ